MAAARRSCLDDKLMAIILMLPINGFSCPAPDYECRGYLSVLFRAVGRYVAAGMMVAVTGSELAGLVAVMKVSAVVAAA